MKDWWTDQSSALISALGGTLVGLLGAAFGVAASVLAPKGRYRRLVLGLNLGLIVLGALGLAAGIIAVLLGQPYRVYYPLLLLGGILLSVSWGCWPAVKRKLDEADARRFEAEQFRRGNS